MSRAALFSDAMWADVGASLRGGARKWWKANESAFVGLTHAEVYEIANYLKVRNRYAAKEVLASHMSRKDYVAWRDNTTDRLKGIAARRAGARQALENLGWVAAKVLGVALLGVLGA